jgi:short-subunit dehydrogenase
MMDTSKKRLHGQPREGNMAERIAIITGASSGLGREFIRQLDHFGEDLFPAEKDGIPVRPFDAFWVIARRRDRLEELAKETKTPVRVLPMDLTDKQAIEDLSALLDKEDPDVRLLINAAGFGKIGSWRDIPLAQVDQMIDLNCRAAVDVTQICLPHMQAGGHIMEICSTAAFQPFQYLNVYAASKAFLYRYSRALSTELRKDRIRVTAVCPYWIRDTEFIPVAQKTGDAAYIHGFPFSDTVDHVAARALSDASLGLSVSTPGPVCTLHRFFSKLLSSDLLMWIFEGIRRL